MMSELLKEEEKLLYRLRAMYRCFGYHPFQMSKFEKYELYAGNKDFLVSDRVITFYDTNGEMMALKPDVTLSIVRNAEFHTGHCEKFYYHENVYRPSRSSGQFREIMQCGLECIGDLDSYDEFEVMLLAEKSLKEISDVCVLSFSHLGILQSLLERLHVDEQSGDEIRHLIATRNRHELAALFKKRLWDDLILRDLETLLDLNCLPAELPEYLKNISWLDGKVLSELRELSTLYSMEESSAYFDFTVSSDLHYYNGLVFQGFVPGISEKLLSGGRYDRLLERMGKQGSAIGFAVYFELLDQLKASEESLDADVLLIYDGNTVLSDVKKEVMRLNKDGKSVSAQRSTEGHYKEILDLRGGTQNA